MTADDAERTTPTEWLAGLAKEVGCTKKDLRVQSFDNDPFNVGTPAHQRDAQWFADAWNELVVPGGEPIHIRRFHYRLMSRGWTKPNGEQYAGGTTEDVHRDYHMLGQACKHARILGLVDRDDVDDKRSRDIEWNGTDQDDDQDHRDPEAAGPILSVPEVQVEQTELDLYSPWVQGYNPTPADHPYRLLIVVEKSTMADILGPICQRLGVAMLSGNGTISHTRTREMLLASPKPLRLGYVSDLDPMGESMPNAVARQMQFLAWDEPDGIGQVDVALTPIALTAEQVERYGLPRSPESGVTELDALEEFHPGELARLVTEFIEQWRDPDHAAALREAADEARRLVSDVYEPHAADITAAHGRVAAQYAAASARYRLDLQRIGVGEEMRFLQELVAAASADLGGVEMPPRPVAVVHDTADEWLYRSDRDYMTQMPFFSRRSASTASKPKKPKTTREATT